MELGQRLADDAAPTERFLLGPRTNRGSRPGRGCAGPRLAPVALLASAVAQFVGLVSISLWMAILFFNVALSLLSGADAA